MKEMRLDLDADEAMQVVVGNVRVHIWRIGDDILSLSTNVNSTDDIQVEVDTTTGEIRQIKHPSKNVI